MTAPKTIADALIAAMRLVPELVTAMNGDEQRISAYTDTFPQSVQLWQAISDIAPPGILVVWNGTIPGGRGLAEIWVHEFSVIVRSRPESFTALGVSDIWKYFVDGVPTGMGGHRLLFTEIDTSLHRMETPSIRRISLPINERDALDYFEITVRFTEKGA